MFLCFPATKSFEFKKHLEGNWTISVEYPTKDLNSIDSVSEMIYARIIDNEGENSSSGIIYLDENHENPIKKFTVLYDGAHGLNCSIIGDFKFDFNLSFVDEMYRSIVLMDDVTLSFNIIDSTIPIDQLDVINRKTGDWVSYRAKRIFERKPWGVSDWLPLVLLMILYAFLQICSAKLAEKNPPYNPYDIPVNPTAPAPNKNEDTQENENKEKKPHSE